MQRVLKAGTIMFGGAGSTALSATFPKRAALEVASVVGVPIDFSLIIQSDNFNRKCRVVWRKLNRIGVAFDEGDLWLANLKSNPVDMAGAPDFRNGGSVRGCRFL
jgi:hypothetical protein